MRLVGRDGVPPSVVMGLHPVGTVSHRPFPGPPGEVGADRGTRSLPGWAARGAAGLRSVGRDGVRPSVVLGLHPVGTVSHRPFPGPPGEVIL